MKDRLQSHRKREEERPKSESFLAKTSKALWANRDQIRPALAGVLFLTLLTGVFFPLVLALFALPLFPSQAGGSLVARNGAAIGSTLIGQAFSAPGYFHPRPSAAGDGYDATASGGTNLGPANPKLTEGVKGDASGKVKPFAGVRELARAYRLENGLPPGSPIPIDAVTRSGSGLDPDISRENALLQLLRVARTRGVSETALRGLLEKQCKGRQLGFLGEARVAVLPLNLALDRVFPLPAPPQRRQP